MNTSIEVVYPPKQISGYAPHILVFILSLPEHLTVHLSTQRSLFVVHSMQFLVT